MKFMNDDKTKVASAHLSTIYIWKQIDITDSFKGN